MKFTIIVLWESVVWSSVYALSLPPVQVLGQKGTFDLDLVNTTRSIAASSEKSCRSSYGFGLDVASCKNAWEKMPRDSEVYFYKVRERTGAGVDVGVGLPVRFLSDDGLCAIDIRAKAGPDQQLAVSGDSARNIDVSEATKVVLDDCVSISHIGGHVTGFSNRDFLSVVVTKYEPKAVCESTPEDIPFVPFCERVLQTMSARRREDWFASTKDRPTSRYYLLPREIQFPTTGPRCALVVSKDQQSPHCKARWFDLWAAGVEIEVMCVQKGMSGSVHGLGDTKELFITMMAQGGPLALSNGCKTSGHCSQNTTFLSFD